MFRLVVLSQTTGKVIPADIRSKRRGAHTSWCPLLLPVRLSVCQETAQFFKHRKSNTLEIRIVR